LVALYKYVLRIYFVQEFCLSCGGSGVIEGIKEVKVTIPAGKLLVTVPWQLINISVEWNKF